ncbi:MAG: MATE family efflux transporter [Lachnospiraceae bacterium]|jgi:putative MATE family efflux protein|nr:MATE family efflux transporter [Lachnospiraceae bacterium]
MADNFTDARRDERRRMMLEDNLYRVMPVLVVPMIISMLIDSVYNMTDTYFVSTLGITAVAAVGINESLLYYLRALATGLGAGATSVISRHLGAKRDDEACEVATTVLYTGIGILAGVAIIAYLCLDPLIMLLGATATTKEYSLGYARFILISAPFTAGESITSYLLRSEGSARLSMVGTVAGCVINVALDPLFIFVFRMGVAGAALATTISKMVSFCILVSPFVRHMTVLEIRLRYFKPRLALYAEVAKLGAPSFLRSALMTSSFVVLNNIAGGFSDAALAAAAIAKKTTSLVASTVMGFGMGYQPLAGYCWGAGRFDRVKASFRAYTTIGWTAAVVLGGVLALCSRRLVLIFASPDETEVIRLGTIMIVSQCITLIPHVWSVVVNGLCQAAGKPVMSLLVGLSRNFICMIPSLLVLSHVFGVEGLAVSTAVSDTLSLVILLPVVFMMIGICNRNGA